ncbi:MAG: hypothetical protein HYZ44_16890 [Bacteroidetes bacterium]|nr:hypothetical protein [Bacteroidota bacterium]
MIKFYGDSVINNSKIINGRLGYRITKDSLTWTGLNPEWNKGKTEKSFKYELLGDSLYIRYGKGNVVTTYFKVKDENYIDYFLKRNEISLVLPKVENTQQMSKSYETLDIKIGFRGKAIVVYIQDIETEHNEIGKAIRRFVDQADSIIPPEFVCRLFVDENIPCEYTIGLFDYLRLYNIRRVMFVTKPANSNEFNDNFNGLNIGIPQEELIIVEEKNGQ